MDIFNLVRGACVFFYFLLATLLMNSVCSNWRNIHVGPSSYALEQEKKAEGDYAALMQSDPTKKAAARSNAEKNWEKNYKPEYEDDYIVKQFSIIGTCEFGDPQDAPCFRGTTSGFYGDGIIAALLVVAFIIYVGNFIYIIAASCKNIHDKAFYVLPISSGIATVFIIAAVIYFACAWNLVWEYKIVRHHNGVIDNYKTINTGYPHDNKISFSGGFYLAAFSILISIAATLCSAVISIFADRLPRGGGANNNNSPAPPVTVQAAVTAAPPEAPAAAAPQVNIDVQAKV